RHECRGLWLCAQGIRSPLFANGTRMRAGPGVCRKNPRRDRVPCESRTNRQTLSAAPLRHLPGLLPSLAWAKNSRSSAQTAAGYSTSRPCELPYSEVCCGSAGTYNITQTEASLELLAEKMRHAQSTGAQIVATANPGCILQLRAGTSLHRTNQDVLHVVELL